MTKINPEKTGRKQTQGPAGCREAKTLRHPSVSPTPTSLDVLSSFSLHARGCLPPSPPLLTHPPVTRGGYLSALLGPASSPGSSLAAG